MFSPANIFHYTVFISCFLHCKKQSVHTTLIDSVGALITLIVYDNNKRTLYSDAY